MPIEETNQEPLADSSPDAGIRSEMLGDLLKAERERRGFDEKYIADKLHITMHYVRSIEANRFDKLPGAVFAKGYIKSYASLLNMNVASLSHMYDEMTSEQKEIKEEASRRQVARRRSDRNKPWVYASAAMFVLGMGGLWAFNHYSQEAEPAATVQAPAQPSTPSRPTATITSQPIAQTPTPSPAPVTTLTAEPAADLPAPDTGSDTSSDAPAATEPPDLLSALTTLARQPVAADSPAVDSEPVTDESDDGQVIAIDGEGDDVLRISFTGESWIEVNDSEEQQIYRDIREAGDVLEITGNAPFNVLVGDAPYTTMTLNGAEIDVSDNIRIDNSARLTVGL